MKAIERDFKIPHAKLEAGNAEQLIANVVEAWLNLLGSDNVQDVEVVRSDLWDPYYAYFQATAWVRESAVPRGHCHNCGELIRTMIFRGSDWCSDDCRKALQERD